MKLKVAPRAHIDDGFVDLFLRTVTKRSVVLASSSRGYRRYPASTVIEAKRLVELSHGEMVAGSAFEREMGKFMTAPYTEFTARNIKGVDYLMGVTKPVTLVAFGREEPSKWDMGPYLVAIRADSLANTRYGDFVLIPTRDPLNWCRHPHHIGNVGRSENGKYANIDEAITASVSTCLGDFGTILGALVSTFEIADYFRNLYLYLGRYNSNSPLRSMSYYGEFGSFARRL